MKTIFYSTFKIETFIDLRITQISLKYVTLLQEIQFKQVWILQKKKKY